MKGILTIPLVCIALSVSAQDCVLQRVINNAPEGAVITLGAGLYEGNITITKPLTIRSSESGAIIRGEGKDSVIRVSSPHVTLEGLEIEGSGKEHQSIDSCVYVSGAYNVSIRRNTLSDCLFGVNFEKTNQSVIEENRITSKRRSLGTRGDGIRLWYSHSNTVRLNQVDFVRDNVLWYSSGNRIEQNSVENSRYALHFMYANRNKVSRNDLRNNSVGFFGMYCEGSTVTNNIVSNATGAFGIGIGMKEASEMVVEDNDIVYNARAFYLDSSPYQPGTVNIFKNNRILFNTTGIQMHGTLFASDFEGNTFAGNIQDLANDTPGSHVAVNRWRGNLWDNYAGFDRDKDGIGDIVHETWAYADRVWSYKPATRLFFASPLFDLMNFLTRLMPFSDPELLARDETPKVK